MWARMWEASVAGGDFGDASLLAKRIASDAARHAKCSSAEAYGSPAQEQPDHRARVVVISHWTDEVAAQSYDEASVPWVGVERANSWVFQVIA